jgi:hypothetical protein
VPNIPKILHKKNNQGSVLSSLKIALLIYILTRVVVLLLFALNTEFEWTREELNARLGTFDGDLYRKIAEGGYDKWNELQVYSFLPAWPYLLRGIQTLLPFLSVVEVGLILNQILIFFLIWLLWIWLGTFKKFSKISLPQITLPWSRTEPQSSPLSASGSRLPSEISNTETGVVGETDQKSEKSENGLQTVDKLLITFLVIFYPGSWFMNTNYNESLYLVAILGMTLLWINRKYLLSILLAMSAVLLRVNVIVIIGGFVISYLMVYIHNRYNEIKQQDGASGKLFIKTVALDTKRFLVNRWYTVLALLALPLPIFGWFAYFENKYGENMYFASQAGYFQREVSYITGPIEGIRDGLFFLTEAFPFDNLSQGFAQNGLLGIIFLLSLGGIVWLYRSTNRALHPLITAGFLFYALYYTFKVGDMWNNVISYGFYWHILPLALVIAGPVACLMRKETAIYFLPAVFTFYLPLSTGVFVSMSRYVLHALWIFLPLYTVTLNRNRWLALTFLIIFIAGYALTMNRFTQFQWAG